MLGAGNVTSIPVLDVLYELLAFNRVVILKVNPTQDALVPVYERALAPLIEAGFLRIVRGGGRGRRVPDRATPASTTCTSPAPRRRSTRSSGARAPPRPGAGARAARS